MTLHIPEDMLMRAGAFLDAHSDVRDNRTLVALAMMEGVGARRKIVGLTPQQARVLAFLAEEEDRGVVVPTFEDIGRYCAIHSKSSVHRIVHALAAKGAIKIEPNKARSIVVTGRAESNVSTARKNFVEA